MATHTSGYIVKSTCAEIKTKMIIIVLCEVHTPHTLCRVSGVSGLDGVTVVCHWHFELNTLSLWWTVLVQHLVLLYIEGGRGGSLPCTPAIHVYNHADLHTSELKVSEVSCSLL